MIFNRFYNMHIPKTGGTFFRENILRPHLKYFNENGIQTTPEGGGGYGVNNSTQTVHWAWYDEFTQNGSYIFVTLRNPAKRLVSHFAWQAVRSIQDGLSDYTYDDINEYNLDKWIDVFYDEQKDFQSKNLVYFNDNKSTYLESKLLGWKQNDVPRVKHYFFDEHFKNFKIDTQQLKNNIKRCNLIIDSNYLRENLNQLKVLDKIFNDLNIINPNYQITNDVYGNNNDFSGYLYSKLSENKINRLYDMSKIDSDLYFSNDIFTKI